MKINLGTFTGTLIYLAVGLFFYTVLYAPEVFTWYDPWVYIIAILWPFAVMWELAWIILYILLAIVAGGLIYFGYEWIKEKIRGKKTSTIRKKRGF
jgi:hypothetical protein